MKVQQLDPKSFTELQRTQFRILIQDHYEKETKNLQDEYIDLELHPDKDPDYYNYLCNYLDDKFEEELIKFGLYDIYFYQEPKPYTQEEWEEMDSISF